MPLKAKRIDSNVEPRARRSACPAHHRPACHSVPAIVRVACRSQPVRALIAVGTGYTAVSAVLLLQAFAGRPLLSGLR
jgi:hypothetical protein